ncbi:MAG: glycosyltransferase family 4 protein, partial [Chthoniobacteraceae bacterium]
MSFLSLVQSRISIVGKWSLKWMFRLGLTLHAFLLRILRPMRVKQRTPRERGPRTILLTGTFYSENWIMNHLRPIAMSEACGQATVVSTFHGPQTPNVEWTPPPAWLCNTIGTTPARLLTFAVIALKRRPDYLGGFHLIPNGLVVSLLAPLIGARSIYFCGGGPREVLDGGILGNQLLARLDEPDRIAETKLIQAINGIDSVICMGNRSVQFYQSRGVTSDFHVIPGAIDSSRFACADIEKRYDLIFVGRLVQVKRIDLFLETVASLGQHLPHLKAVIVGTGELESELKALSHRLGVTANVDFVGQQSNVTPWLQQSRVFVLTSDSEGLSLAMMEALACGLPCVVSDVGELGEVIQNGMNGYLVAARTGVAFADAIEPILSNAAEFSRLSTNASQSA